METENSPLDNYILNSNLTKSQAQKAFKRYKSEHQHSKRFKGSHQLLGKYIISLILDSWNGKTLNDREKGFYLETNKTSLSKLCDCTPKSIYNQIARLTELEFLLKCEAIKGGLRLWVNPKTIVDSSCPGMKKIHPLSKELIVKNKTINGDKEKIPKNTKEQFSPGTDVQKSVCNVPGESSEYPQKILDHLLRKIYPNQSPSMKRRRILLKLVQSNLSRKASIDQFSEFDAYYSHMKLIDKAHHWFREHPEVIPPDPYHFLSFSKSGFRLCRIEEWEKSKQRAQLLYPVRKKIINESKAIAKSDRLGRKLAKIEEQTKLLNTVNDPKFTEWYKSHFINLYQS